MIVDILLKFGSAPSVMSASVSWLSFTMTCFWFSFLTKICHQ